MGLQTNQARNTVSVHKANLKLIATLWVLVAIKVFCWKTPLYWLALPSELAYIGLALILVFTRAHANRINGSIILIYEVATFALNFILGKFGILIPHG